VRPVSEHGAGGKGSSQPRGLELPTDVAVERLLVGRTSTRWTLPEQIAARLGEQILNEELRPGERIREEAIAESFQVSRGPIRDALRILSAAGLVSITSHRGTVVTSLTEADLQEILELRAALIALALRRFASKASTAQLALVRPHLSAAEALVNDEAKVLIWLEAMDRLVLAIACAAGNSRLASQLTTLSLQAIRYLRRGFGSARSRHELLAFHRDYLRAVERGEDIEGFMADSTALFPSAEQLLPVRPAPSTSIRPTLRASTRPRRR
jgi:DNA-binding GntR family transcriptional regulator